MGSVFQHKPIILLVEDDRDLADVIECLLRDEGFTVAVAPDGERALELLTALDTGRVKAIVTDMMMPVLDGIGLLRALAANPVSHPPILAMSALTEYLTEARKLGADALLQKPFEFEELVAAVTRLSSGKQVPSPKKEARCETLSPSLEVHRLDSIARLTLEQGAPESELHELVHHVAVTFDVPICYISVVTDKEQLWTASCGLPPDLESSSASRAESFCTHAVAARAALVVQDASANPFFMANPWVRNRGLQFYAGVPLIVRSGDVVGTLCIIDFTPRRFLHSDLELLSLFARCVLSWLERREKLQNPDEPASAFSNLAFVDHTYDVLGREGFQQFLTVYAVQAAEQHTSVVLAVCELDESNLATAVDRFRRKVDPGWVGRLGRTRFGGIVQGRTELEMRQRLEQGDWGCIRMVVAACEPNPASLGRALQDLEISLEQVGRAEQRPDRRQVPT